MSDIHDVTVTPLRRIPDERGAVFHMLREDSPQFERFGEIYFSTVYPGVVKGWHIHHRMTLNYAVPVGMIKLVCYDDRPGLAHPGRGPGAARRGAQLRARDDPADGLERLQGRGGRQPALVANCATIPHDPEEIERLDPFENDIPYDWALRHG